MEAVLKETSSKHEEYVEGGKVTWVNPTAERNRAAYPKVKKTENTRGLGE